jgi:hypothetical protein
MEKKMNNLVNIAGEPRVQIIIVEDMAAMTKYCETILLAATMRKTTKIVPAKQDIKDHI